MIVSRLIVLLTCMACLAKVESQTATDFQVTDSWGNSHRLYDDYLNQGTTVVIKIFYVNCPPCNSISPLLEPLYQAWGGGEADVQFIELSILQTDTDAKINVYKENHHTTYPACGGQGGSVLAVAPYRDGTFGVYTGTPTFVVIAPDGSVNYDVYGNNNAATIELLDAAIAATGATGLNTAAEEPGVSFPIALPSNMVSDVLELNVTEGTSVIEVSVVNLLGQTVVADTYYPEKGQTIYIDVSSLPSGLWICRIKESVKGRLASYLFFKAFEH